MHQRSNLLLRYFLPAAAGFAAGTINGLLGAAGGILLAAVLPFLPPLSDTRPLTDRRDVLATALAVMLPTSVVSFLLYLWRGIRPPVPALAAILFPAAVGGLAGAFLLGRIPRTVLQKSFALVVVLSGIRMLWG